MIHLATMIKTGTSLTQVMRDVAKKRSDLAVSTVKVNNKVTVGAYFPSEKIDSIPTTPKQLKELKFVNQKSLKLKAGDGLLLAVPKSQRLDPKKQMLWIYDQDFGWGKINGGNAKKLVEASDVSISKIYDILDARKENKSNLLKDLQGQIMNLFEEAAKEAVNIINENARVSTNGPRFDIEIRVDSMPSVTYTLNQEWSYNIESRVSMSSAYIYDFNLTKNDGKKDMDNMSKFIDIMSKVEKAVKIVNKKYVPQLVELSKKQYEIREQE
jgi:hypothetical protein